MSNANEVLVAGYEADAARWRAIARTAQFHPTARATSRDVVYAKNEAAKNEDRALAARKAVGNG